MKKLIYALVLYDILAGRVSKVTLFLAKIAISLGLTGIMGIDSPVGALNGRFPGAPMYSVIEVAQGLVVPEKGLVIDWKSGKEGDQ